MILKISLTILLSALLLWGFVSLMDPDEQEVMKEVGMVFLAAMVFLLATIVGSAIVAMLYVWIWSL